MRWPLSAQRYTSTVPGQRRGSVQAASLPAAPSLNRRQRRELDRSNLNTLQEAHEADPAELLRELNSEAAWLSEALVQGFNESGPQEAAVQGTQWRQCEATPHEDWALEGVAEHVQAWQDKQQAVRPAHKGMTLPIVLPSSSNGGALGGTHRDDVIQLDAAYMRDNARVVSALRAQGRRVVATGLVGDPDSDSDSDSEDEDEGLGAYDGEGDDTWLLGQDDTLSTSPHRSCNSSTSAQHTAAQASASHRTAQPLVSSKGPSGVASWYRDLKQAGFAIGGGAAGDAGVYLERRRTMTRPSRAINNNTVSSTTAAPVTVPALKPDAAVSAGATAAASSSAESAARGSHSATNLEKSLEDDNGGSNSPLVLAAAGLAAGCLDPQELLHLLSLSRPAWAANGFRAIGRETGLKVADAPSPGEAAHLLMATAAVARRLQLPAVRRLGLAREQSVVGLAECLAVVPPRLLPEQDPATSTSLYAAARSYWLGSAPTRLRGPHPSAVGTPPSTGAHSSAGGHSSSGGTDASYQQLLRKYISAQACPSAAAGPAGAAAAAAPSDTAARVDPGAAAGVLAGVVGAAARLPARTADSAAAEGAGAASASDGVGACGGAVSSGVAAAPRPTRGAVPPALARPQKAAPDGKQAAAVAAVWALSVLGGPELFRAEMDALLQVLVLGSGRLSTNAVGQLMWGLGNAHHWSPLLSDLEASIVQMGGLTAFTPAQATTVLWSFATLAHTPTRLLSTVPASWSTGDSSNGGGNITRKGSGSGGSAARIKAGAPGKQLKGAAAQAAARALPAYTLPQLASVAWSLAALQQLDTAPLRAVWGELERRVAAPSVRGAPGGGEVALLCRNNVALTQLWQTAMAIKLEATTWKLGDGGDVSPSLQRVLATAEATFVQQTSALRHKVHSSYQRQIANTLRTMRLMHTIEDNSTGYAIDVTVPSLRLAIEADGPTHAARTHPRHALGATRMKQRHLRAQGWSLLSIAFDKWDGLAAGGEAARVSHLRTLIQVACQPQE